MTDTASAPGDAMKAMAEFWSGQADTIFKAQADTGRAFLDGMQALAGGGSKPGAEPTELTQATQAMTELWSAAAEMGKLVAEKLPASGDDTVAAVLARIADPRQWMSGTGEMDDVLGRMAEGPRLADMGEIERLTAKVLQAWIDVRRRTLEHNAVVLEGWLAAGRRFTEAHADPATDAKAVMASWTATANRQLLAMQRSDAFLASQRETIRASTALRMAQQELVEHFGRQYGFPTRTELDDVHRTVTEMRRELRAMKRDRRQAAAEAPEPAAPAPVPAPVTGATRRTAKQRGPR